jgi:Membrane protein involved in the export of O-antigen and teichoic acid
MFALSFVTFFTIFVDFGFNYTSTRDISANRKNSDFVEDTFWHVIFAKLFLFLIASLIFSILVFSIPRFRLNSSVYLVFLFMVGGNAIFPNWLFQGVEKMRVLAIINVISKVLLLLPVVFLVKSEEDILVFPLLYSLSFLFAGLIGFFYAYFSFDFKFRVVSFSDIFKQLKYSKDIFFSNFFINIYFSTNAFVLGLVTGRNDFVGYYSISEKAVRGIRYLISPITDALFPFLSHKFHTIEIRMVRRTLVKVLIYTSPLIFGIIAGLIIFPHYISKLLSGSSNDHIVNSIIIMSPVILLGTINSVFGVLGLITIKREVLFRNSVIATGILNFGLCILLSSYFKVEGAAFAVLVSEAFLCCLLTYKLFRI